MLREFIRCLLTEALKKESEFTESMSPDVMELLINNYAQNHPNAGMLKWEYGPLDSQTWGQFVADGRIGKKTSDWLDYRPRGEKLIVNKTMTKGLFKQQVSTILHEIQHWNQYVELTGDVKSHEQRLNMWARAYDSAARSASAVVSEEEFQRMIEELPVKDKVILKKIEKRSHRAYQEALYLLRRNAAKHVKYQNNEYEADARKFSDDNIEEAMGKIGKHYGGKLEGGDLDTVIEELFDDYEEGTPITRLQIGTALRDWDLNTGANMKQVIAALKDLGVKIQGM